MPMLRDDPIVSSLERTGLPPWQSDRFYTNKHYSCGGFGGYEEDDFEEDDGDVYYGNETSSF